MLSNKKVIRGTNVSPIYNFKFPSGHNKKIKMKQESEF